MITPEDLARSGSEHGHQTALFCWASTSNIPELKWLYAIPNGFYATAKSKAAMKAEGLKSGISDICLPVSQRSIGNTVRYCGLYIEMKRKTSNAGLSNEQLKFSQFIIGQGYKFKVCYSWIEARDAILEYLGKV